MGQILCTRKKVVQSSASLGSVEGSEEIQRYRDGYFTSIISPERRIPTRFLILLCVYPKSYNRSFFLLVVDNKKLDP